MADTAEQSVSLRDDLSKIYDEQSETETEEPVEAAEEEAPKEGRKRDESGKFVKAAQAEEETEEVAEAAEEQETEEVEAEAEAEPGLEPPQHWSAEDKAVFSKLQKEGQEFLLRRHKDMEADYTRKTQEVADVKRFRDNVDQLFTPYRNQFAMHGLDDVGAIRYLVGWYSSLQQNPAQTLMRLAADYGVDFTKEAEAIDPKVQPILNKVHALESQIAQAQQAQQIQVNNSLLEQVNSFRDAKDEKGNLKHPHFETVRQDMSVLIESGRAKTLDDAYSLAVRLHPDIYDKQVEQSIQQKLKATQVKDQDALKQKAVQAKKAASGIRSGSASVEKQGPKTLRAQLSELYDQQATS